MRRLADPLLVCVVIGALIFAADAWLGDNTSDRTIEVTSAQVERLASLWEMQMGRAPSDTELDALVDDFIREEVLVREAVRLGLDHDDTIIRRRLAQKLSFLSDNLAVLEPATEEALRAYFAANTTRYATPAVMTFSHVFFSPERRQDAASDAAAALERFQPDAWRQTGDPFMLGRTYTHASHSRIARDFGEAFLSAIQELPARGQWQGPVESAYGFHLLRVDASTPAVDSNYDAVADRVRRDYDAQRRADANAEHFDALREQYDIRLPP